jgi:formylglycine-generating enzyme required for sulfatase activity
VKGSIEAAVERALKAADADASIPRDRPARLDLLRRGLIPWLAGIDPDTGAPRRRVARLAEIPAAARPLIQHLVDQRLLATDMHTGTGEATIEPAHEALLRQWSLLQGWLTEDAGLLAILEGVKRAGRDWAENEHNRAWVAHQTDRLVAAERLSARPDLSANLDPTDKAYIAACRKAEDDSKRRRRLLHTAVYISLVAVILGLVGWINESHIAGEWRYLTVTVPYERASVRAYVLSTAKEQALKPQESFKECASDEGKDYCPEMIVVPGGTFMMGSPPIEKGRYVSEDPQHLVTIGKRFAVSKFALTFDEWDACVTYGDCLQGISDNGWGRGRQPVINVTWDDAQRYVGWLAKMTSKPYRLLTEAEYEYATRAGTQTAYPWGDDVGKNNANCLICGSNWDGKQRTAPVGSFQPNGFGLYDMVGNVFEWVEDCYNASYNRAPTNGSAWVDGDCQNRMARAGSWFNAPIILRSANRAWFAPGVRMSLLGFRIGRTLIAP